MGGKSEFVTRAVTIFDYQDAWLRQENLNASALFRDLLDGEMARRGALRLKDEVPKAAAAP